MVKKTQKKKKSNGEPTITEYLTYRRAKRLMAKFKDKFGRHHWNIKYTDDGSVCGNQLQITHESFNDIPHEELTELIKGVIELNVRFTVWFYPHTKTPWGEKYNPKHFSLDIEVR